MAHQSHTTDQVFARALTGLTSAELKKLLWYHAERLADQATHDSALRHMDMVEDERVRRRARVSGSARAHREAGRSLTSDSPL